MGNDLPRFEAQFKDSLNQNTIHEVVAFNAFLDSRRQDIVNRIGEINQSLAGIEYNPGRHIQLEHQTTSDPDVREFGSDLRACSEGTIGDEDQYSEQKYLQVERLIERFRGRDGTDRPGRTLDRQGHRRAELVHVLGVGEVDGDRRGVRALHRFRRQVRRPEGEAGLHHPRGGPGVPVRAGLGTAPEQRSGRASGSW